jgi:hypothetical protein
MVGGALQAALHPQGTSMVGGDSQAALHPRCCVGPSMRATASPLALLQHLRLAPQGPVLRAQARSASTLA